MLYLCGSELMRSLSSGHFIQTRQSLLWRPVMTFSWGLFMTQFCDIVSHRSLTGRLYTSYPTNHPRTTSTLPDHITRTSSDFATRDAIDLLASPSVGRPLLNTSIQGVPKSLSWIRLLILAAERLFDQEFAEVEQVGPELSACSRELVEGV